MINLDSYSCGSRNRGIEKSSIPGLHDKGLMSHHSKSRLICLCSIVLDSLHLGWKFVDESIKQDGWYLDKRHFFIVFLSHSYKETGFGVTLFLGGIGNRLLTPHCKFHVFNVNGWWSMCLKHELMVGKLTSMKQALKEPFKT